MNGELLVKATVWVLSAVLALVFVSTGLGKLAGLEGQLARHAAWGWPAGGFMALGILEVAGGIFLVLPRRALFGAGLLCLTLLLSAAMHFFHEEQTLLIRALVLVFLLLGICYLRLKRLPPGSPDEEADGLSGPSEDRSEGLSPDRAQELN